jgi:hypothetical protein
MLKHFNTYDGIHIVFRKRELLRARQGHKVIYVVFMTTPYILCLYVDPNQQLRLIISHISVPKISELYAPGRSILPFVAQQISVNTSSATHIEYPTPLNLVHDAGNETERTSPH